MAFLNFRILYNKHNVKFRSVISDLLESGAFLNTVTLRAKGLLYKSSCKAIQSGI